MSSIVWWTPFRMDNQKIQGELSKDDILLYTHVRNLLGNLGLSTTTLQGAGNVEVPWLVGRIQELYGTASAPIERDIEYLSANGGPEFEELIRLSRLVLDEAKGDSNIFDRAERRINLITGESSLIAKNNNILQRLLVEIDALAADVQGEPQPSTMPVEVAGDPGVTDDEILFGQSAALEGPAAALGEGMRLGIQTAFHEANQAGGVNDRQLTLTTLHDDYEDIFAFGKTQQLIERHRVFGLIGAVGTPTSRAALHCRWPRPGMFLSSGPSPERSCSDAMIKPTCSTCAPPTTTKPRRWWTRLPGEDGQDQSSRALSERLLRTGRAGRRASSCASGLPMISSSWPCPSWAATPCVMSL